MRILGFVAWTATSAFAAESVTIESSYSAESDWSELYRTSFSGTAEASQEDIKVDESASDELLLSAASLPVRFVFGEPTKRWSGEEAPSSYVEDRRASTKLEVEGCKLKIKTGPIQIATYELSRGQFAVTSDSLPPRSQLNLPENGDAYISASAELSVELIGKAKATCSKRLAGRLVPVGKFSFDSTQIRVAGPNDEHDFEVATSTKGVVQDIYLMWPAGADVPVLLDAMGPHPQIETGIRRIHVASGDLYLDVAPDLERVSELQGDVQRAASLEALYGQRAR